MHRTLLLACTLLAFILPATARAQTLPAADMQKQVAAFTDFFKVLPIAELQGALDAINTAQESTSPSDSFIGRKSGKWQFYLDRTTFQVGVLIYDGTLELPFKSAFWNNLAGTRLVSPMFFLSNLEGDLGTEKLPADFKKLIADKYYGIKSLKVNRGFGVMSRTELQGYLAQGLRYAVGAPVKNNGKLDFALRVAFASTDVKSEKPESNLDKARARLAKYRTDYERDVLGERPPKNKLVLEFQMGPGDVYGGPLGMSPAKLQDGFIRYDTTGTLSYTGNLLIDVDGKNKTMFATFEGPLSIFQKAATTQGDLLELTDVRLGLYTPDMSLKDFVGLSIAMTDPTRLAQKSGNADVKNIANALNKAKLVLTPLDAFKLKNPLPKLTYKVGDEMPEVSKFNVVFLGPNATHEDKKGPVIKLVGDAVALGHTFGRMKTDISTSGIHGDVAGDLTINLDSVGLGKPGVKMNAGVHIDDKQQNISIGGPLAPTMPDRHLAFYLGNDGVSVRSAATCLTPIDVDGKIPFSSFSFSSLPLTAVKPDFAALVKCGDKLADGAKWLGKQTFKGAKEIYGEGAKAGKFIADGTGDAAKAGKEAAEAAAKASEAAAKAAAEAATKAANAARDAARNAANAAASAAANAARDTANAVVGGATKTVNAVGSAFGGGGKKTCNQRIEWLRERQAESERAGGDAAGLWVMPAPTRIDHFVGQVFQPLLGLVPKGNAYSAHGQALEDKWERAGGAFDAMTKHWNARLGPNPAQRPVSAYLETVKPNQKIKTALRDLKNRRMPNFILDAGSRGYLKDWAGFRPYSAGWAGRNEGEHLWHRCANVHTADVPVRMAQAWKTYVPQMKDVSSMFMSPHDYARVRRELAQRVASLHGQLDGPMNQINQASQDWTHHSADFVRDFLVHAEGRLRPKTRVAMADPARTAELAPLVKEWNAALLNFKNMLTGTLTLAAIPDANAAAKATDDLIAAAFKLNKAVIADATE